MFLWSSSRRTVRLPLLQRVITAYPSLRSAAYAENAAVFLCRLSQVLQVYLSFASNLESVGMQLNTAAYIPSYPNPLSLFPGLTKVDGKWTFSVGSTVYLPAAAQESPNSYFSLPDIFFKLLLL